MFLVLFNDIADVKTDNLSSNLDKSYIRKWCANENYKLKNLYSIFSSILPFIYCMIFFLTDIMFVFYFLTPI